MGAGIAAGAFAEGFYKGYSLIEKSMADKAERERKIQEAEAKSKQAQEELIGKINTNKTTVESNVGKDDIDRADAFKIGDLDKVNALNEKTRTSINMFNQDIAGVNQRNGTSIPLFGHTPLVDQAKFTHNGKDYVVPKDILPKLIDLSKTDLGKKYFTSTPTGELALLSHDIKTNSPGESIDPAAIFPVLGVDKSKMSDRDKDFAAWVKVKGNEGKTPIDMDVDKAQRIELAKETPLDKQQKITSITKDVETIKNDKTKLGIQQQELGIKSAGLNIQQQALTETKKQNSLENQQKILDIGEKNKAIADKKQAARNTVNNTVNTINRILKNKELDNVVGTVKGRMPGVNGGQTNAIADIETLQSQIFLTQVQQLKGTGALSDTEGAKLDKSVASLSRVQTTEQLTANLKTIRTLVMKGYVNQNKPKQQTTDKQIDLNKYKIK